MYYCQMHGMASLRLSYLAGSVGAPHLTTVHWRYHFVVPVDVKHVKTSVQRPLQCNAESWVIRVITITREASTSTHRNVAFIIAHVLLPCFRNLVLCRGFHLLDIR